MPSLFCWVNLYGAPCIWMGSGGSRIWPREGPTCQRGPPVPGRPLKLWWVPSRFEGQRGPFEASDAQRAHYEIRMPLRAAQRASSDTQRAPLWAQRVPQEISESFQRALKYLLKLTDHSFGHSKSSFGSIKGPFEAKEWDHGPMPPPPPGSTTVGGWPPENAWRRS